MTVENSNLNSFWIAQNKQALLSTFTVTVISTTVGIGFAARMRSSLIKAGLISFVSGLCLGGAISKYWQKRKINHVGFGRYFNSNFFEEALFKDKIASQCRNHSEFHAMVGICLLLLQLIKEPQDQPVVYRAFENLRLEDLYTYAPSLRESIANKDTKPFFVNNDKSLYYQFGVEKAFSIMSQIRFSKDEVALTADELSEVMKCLTDRMCVMFHGTNSFFLERIKQEGLRGNSANQFDTQINQLQKDLKCKMFGFHNGQPKTVYYQTRNPEEAFHYAKGSPEWFQSFLGGRTLPETRPSHYFRYEKRDGNRVR